MPNFGYEEICPSNVNLGSHLFGCVDTCPEAGSAQSITVYLDGWASGEKVKCALYDANEDFVAETEERTTGGAAGWFIFEFSSPPSVTNQAYTIAVISDLPIYVKYKWTETLGYGLKYALLAPYGDGFPASCAGGEDYDDKALSIFCTYSTNVAPTAPTSLEVDEKSDPTGANCISSLTPGFTAIFNDPDAGDQSNAIQIQVGTASGLSDMWDSDWLADSTIEGNRCTAKTYAGTVLLAGTSYWWRCRFKDDDNAVGAWSAWQQFDMCTAPALNLVQMSLV